MANTANSARFQNARAKDENTKTDNPPEPNEPTHPPVLDKEEDDEQYIVHRTNVVNPETGQPEIKEHRVLLKDWPEYEKKHNL